MFYEVTRNIEVVSHISTGIKMLMTNHKYVYLGSYETLRFQQIRYGRKSFFLGRKGQKTNTFFLLPVTIIVGASFNYRTEFDN